MNYYNFALKYVKRNEGKILDAGCGYGYGTYYLSLKTKNNVVGVDIDKKANYKEKRIRNICKVS